jgi:ABC-type amino acid transport substrate-binding protein
MAMKSGLIALALLASTSLAIAQTSPSVTLDRIRDTSRVRLGYRADARPFSYRDESGNAAGYSVGLCQQIVAALRSELRLPALSVEWVPVTAPDRFSAVREGAIDMLCGADTVTLDRRTQVAFSTPIFPGGIGAMMRSDAPVPLRDVLSGKGQSFHPTWRASASQLVRARAFAAVSGTTAETWLTSRINDLDVITPATTVSSYDAGVSALLARQVDAVFGERAILFDAVRRHAASRDLVVLDRLFTYEPLALAMPANDEGFRLTVDRALTRFNRSGGLVALYTTWFGEPGESAMTFFRWNTLAD